MTQGKESKYAYRWTKNQHGGMPSWVDQEKKCTYVDFALMDMQSQENKQSFIIKQNSFTHGCQNHTFIGANW